MRLHTIRTERLFGIFDHSIHLNVDDRITIIHGPNGYGKTAILRLISDIFGSRHTALRELPFQRIILEFSEGPSLTVQKGRVSRGSRGANLEASAQTLSQNPSVSQESRGNIVFLYPPNKPFHLSASSGSDVASAIDKLVPNVTRIDYDAWQNDYTGEILTVDEVLDRFSNHFPPGFGAAQYPDWLVSLRDSLDVHFIRATRLESQWASSRPARRRRRSYSPSVVATYAEELAEHIRTTLATYAELSQSLDRSFPRRLVTTSEGAAISMQEIRTRLADLEQKRKRLTDAGLLDKEAETHFDVASIDETKAEVLSLYIADVEQKLAVFDKLYARIDLLRTILNRRFSFKTVYIDKTEGIQFQTDDGAPLAPNCLSSGEQHEVVLLYQLLFRVKANSLILIDEPELSLHIAWQEQFLNDLAQITTLSSFDVLIATHSPQIISDRWDLTVELKGPSQCKNTLPSMQLLTQ